MGKFEKLLKEVAVPISPYCLECPAFKDMLTNSERYDGATPNDIAALALRLCQKPPITHPAVKADGSEPEYWETQLPTCELGDLKLTLDAQRNIDYFGLDIDLGANFASSGEQIYTTTRTGEKRQTKNRSKMVEQYRGTVAPDIDLALAGDSDLLGELQGMFHTDCLDCTKVLDDTAQLMVMRCSNSSVERIRGLEIMTEKVLERQSHCGKIALIGTCETTYS